MFAEFIDEIGPKNLSIVFGVPIQTIYSWKRRNRVPRSRWDKIMETWPRVTFKKLREMEYRSREAELNDAA